MEYKIKASGTLITEGEYIIFRIYLKCDARRIKSCSSWKIMKLKNRASVATAYCHLKCHLFLHSKCIIFWFHFHVFYDGKQSKIHIRPLSLTLFMFSYLKFWSLPFFSFYLHFTCISILTYIYIYIYIIIVII